MDILYQHILPLFVKRPLMVLNDDHIGKLVPNSDVNGNNSYLLTVSLEQVFRGDLIRVMIPSDQPFEFEIPANYFEVCLTGKGFGGSDVNIQVINRRDSRFLRIGSVDLFGLVGKKDTSIVHLDGSILSLIEDNDDKEFSDVLIKIPGKGLPIPGKSGQERGNLYVVREDNKSEKDWRLWLEILNCHENANQVNLIE